MVRLKVKQFYWVQLFTYGLMSLSLMIVSSVFVPLLAQETKTETKAETKTEVKSEKADRPKRNKGDDYFHDNSPRILGKNRNHNAKNGFYLGLGTHYGTISNGAEEILLAEARVAFVSHHVFAVGLAARGLASDIDLNLSGSTNDYFLTGGYGGLFFEPIIGARMPIHITTPVLVGLGWAGYFENDLINEWEFNEDPVDWDVMLVVEPGVHLEFNLAKFMRLNLGVNYRFTSDLELADLDNDAFNGLSGGLTLKLGKF